MKTLGEEGIPAEVLTLAMAVQKLRHAADNGEFSATIKPLEAHALLDEFERLYDEIAGCRHDHRPAA